ncbi:MAG: DUF3086 domain-containing protein, partial [Leptolyngbyaceae cyanobacterium CAN_BIN12]|nr:DUF3086 domain-containing protein [Leptolyngbyaceae cyanobacterium CAN_BIN12]
MTPNELPLDTAKPEESLGIQEASMRSLIDEEVTALPGGNETAETVPENTVIAKVPFGGVAPVDLEQRIAELQRQEKALQQNITQLQATKSELQGQMTATQAAIASLLQEGLKELEQRKRDLQTTVEKLERRQERIRAEMRTTFAGTSQDLAIRVQSFKDYLVGSLQDLALAADQLELTKFKEPEKPPVPIAVVAMTPQTPTPKFA